MATALIAPAAGVLALLGYGFGGCYRLGHKSNRDCYVKATHTDGTLTFTSHAAT